MTYFFDRLNLLGANDAKRHFVIHPPREDYTHAHLQVLPCEHEKLANYVASIFQLTLEQTGQL